MQHAAHAPQPPKLLDRMRIQLRTRHYSIRAPRPPISIEYGALSCSMASAIRRIWGLQK